MLECFFCSENMAAGGAVKSELPTWT